MRLIHYLITFIITNGTYDFIIIIKYEYYYNFIIKQINNSKTKKINY